MPNAFAYIVLLSWPIIVLILFRLMTVPRALAFSVVGGYLFLPTQTSFDVPMLPSIDKTFVSSVSAAIMCYLWGRVEERRPHAGRKVGPLLSMSAHQGIPEYQRSRRSRLLTVLLATALVFPLVTVWQNADSVIAGPRIIPALGVRDGFSMIAGTIVMLIPFFLASRFLSSQAAQKQMLQVIVGLASIYAILVLFEARMSPQLNTWIYGFFAHSWLQHMRSGGFRPLVFLEHGLWLAIFMAVALLSALAIRRSSSSDVPLAGKVVTVLWLGFALYFCRSLGALVVAIPMGVMLLLASPKRQIGIAAATAALILLYPMLRGAGLVPVESVQAVAQSINQDRASSFAFRVENEDQLLERANLKPWSGWGGWGRSRVWDPETGRGLSIADGAWILVIGEYGWIGYVAIFGFLTLPTILLWRNRNRIPIPPVTAGLSIVLAAALLDLIPNATLTPVTWLLAGAIAGHYQNTIDKSAISAAGTISKSISEG